MTSRFTELIIDAADPGGLARFWEQVLGYQRTFEENGVVEIRGQAESGPSLVFVPVPEPKTLKNRLHIDVNPVDVDQRAEVERLLALGARRVDIGQGDQTWVVLADPEGNEFCVLRSPVDSQ
jgi:hypothetical protein